MANAEFLDAALLKPSLEVYDDLLSAYYSGDRLLGADKAGFIQARRQTHAGDTVDGIEAWVPGQDSVTSLDVAKSLASDEPRTKKLVDNASPDVLHVVLDIPDRLKTAEGKYLAKNVGLFALSVSAVIARETGAQLRLYHNDGTRSRMLFNDTRLDDMYVGYEDIERGIEPARNGEFSTDGTLEGLLRLSSEHMDVDNDGLVVVSDFQDGFTGGQFNWQEIYQNNQASLDGRMRTVRLQSTSHLRPNVLHSQLSPWLVQEIEREYQGPACLKEAKITEILGDTVLSFSLSAGLDQAGRRPSESISDYITQGNL